MTDNKEATLSLHDVVNEAFEEWMIEYERENDGARLAEMDIRDALRVAFEAGALAVVYNG